MTQAQLNTYLAGKVGIDKKQSKGLLDELTALVVKQLKKEGVLRLSGLGIFRKRKSKARIGWNPATAEQIKIPARTRLRFTAAKGLKDALFERQVRSIPPKRRWRLRAVDPRRSPGRFSRNALGFAMR